MTAIVLDAGPLGLATNPRLSDANLACYEWIIARLADGVQLVVPEIADYEVRRELLRASKHQGIARLDTLVSVLDYWPITTAALRVAAGLWARSRQQGRPTAPDASIDGDAILAAQVLSSGLDGAVVATTNVGHLGQYVLARAWQEIV